MNILYVKSNSERTKKFQIQTIVYEESGQKYVTKKAMYKEAIPHLKKMKESYEKLTASIIDPNIKLAKIIKESENSLTFEFIDGISFATKLNNAEKSEEEKKQVINKYLELLKTGFKTIKFNSSTMVTDAFKELFGEHDYSELNGELCFDGISNLDLILSNIIFKGKDIYIIDYEWIFDINAPVDYVVFRTLHSNIDLYWKMEKRFIYHCVADKTSFLQMQENYFNDRFNIAQYIKDKDAQVANMDLVVQDRDSIIYDKEVHIQHQNSQLKNKNDQIQAQNNHIENQEDLIKEQIGHIEHWHNVAQSMTIKNRIKNLVKPLVPKSLLNSFKKTQEQTNSIESDTTSTDTIPIVNEYLYLKPLLDQKIEEELNAFESKPLISIIMPVYNVAPKWLDLAIKSIEDQWYDNWELCIADDKSTDQETIEYLKNINNPKIKIKYLEKNLNISGSSNEALKLTTGDYIALMDNDDELTPDALYEVVKVINREGAEFIYSDEDKLEMDGTHSDPHFKPNFAPDMFLSQNYLSHLGVIKKELITKVEGFTIGLEGSQDFDLYLKVLEQTDKIYHIEKVLYHWRKIPGSTAAEYSDKSYAQEAGRKALENAMLRRNIDTTVKNGNTPGTYKVDYMIKGTPLVSIIIPFKDKPELIKVCIESILEKSTYQNFEIIAISNNSTESETFKEIKYLENLDERISFYEYNVPFNYSKINNYATKEYAKGEHILFLNNDIEVITPNWIEEMLMYSQLNQNGAIGAKLYFPNDTVQHAGLIMAPKTIHSVILVYQGYTKDASGYGARLQCVNNYSAVTAACLMLKREIFNEINGFDEERLSVAYNDVDLCLRIQEAGYHNIWTPYCELYHHESISRGYEISRKSVERREKEKYNLKCKHPEIFSEGDPFYNRNLTRFSLTSGLDESVKKTHESVNGIPFYEKILISKNIHTQKNDKVCLFSHFDAENKIKEYIIYYLKELSKVSDIIFISTAEGVTQEALKQIEPYCKDIIVKKNIGYDFGAWKSGLDYLGDDLNTYEQLILCNDSVFGPFHPLKSIFDKMSAYDAWSMSDNHEIEYHLQSYFMVYNKKAFNSNLFEDFWNDFKIYTNKQILIETNEIGFSNSLFHSDLSCGAFYSVKERNYVNVLQYYWKELIAEHQFPFIKKEVLTTNPLQLDTSNWEEVIRSVSTYNTNLIKNILKQI